MKFITYWLLIISFVGQVYVLHAQENRQPEDKYEIISFRWLYCRRELDRKK